MSKKQKIYLAPNTYITQEKAALMGKLLIAAVCLGGIVISYTLKDKELRGDLLKHISTGE